MNLNVSDNYIAGFVDGEGMFYVGVVPSRGSSRNRCGWQVIYFFKVSQNPKGKIVLDKIKKRLECGYIKPNNRHSPTDKSLAYVVRDLPSLRERVIPFFEGKLVVKRKTLAMFKSVIELVNLKKHLTKKGMKEVLDISYLMNTQKRKFSKKLILDSFKD